MSQGNAKGSGGSSYSPAIPSNWETVPSTATQALDEIAANVPLNFVIPRPSQFSTNQMTLSIDVNTLFVRATNFYFDSVNNLFWVTDGGSAVLHAINATTFQLAASINLATYIDTTTLIKADTTHIYVNHTTGALNGNYVLIISKASKTLVGILNAVGAANDFAVDNGGQVWVVDTGNLLVRLFTAADVTSAITNFPTPQTASGGTFLGANNPNSICYDSVDNQIWVGTLGHPTNEQLYQLNTSGTTLNTYDATGLTFFNDFSSLIYYNGFVWCGTDAASILQVNPATFTTGSGIDGGAVVELDIGTANSTTHINIDTFTTTILVGDNNGTINRVHAVVSPTVASTITLPSGNTAAIGIIGPKLLIAKQAAGIFVYTDVVGSETEQGFYGGPFQSLGWNAPSIIDGVTVSGVPSIGQVITATSTTAADWQTPTPPPIPATTIISSDYTALTTDRFIGVKNTLPHATITIFLPSFVSTSLFFIIKDGFGNAATNNIIINGNGFNIDGSPTNTISSNFGFVQLWFDGTGWNLI